MGSVLKEILSFSNAYSPYSSLAIICCLQLYFYNPINSIVSAFNRRYNTSSTVTVSSRFLGHVFLTLKDSSASTSKCSMLEPVLPCLPIQGVLLLEFSADSPQKLAYNSIFPSFAATALPGTGYLVARISATRVWLAL